MTIAIGSDHRGLVLKDKIKKFLLNKKIRVLDKGTYSLESADYPEFGLTVANAVIMEKAKYGILICYSGQGMAIAANKVKGIRAAIAWKPEIARLARGHNDANILVLPVGFIKSRKSWQKAINYFLKTKFEGGRHLRRLTVIKNYEKHKR